jgi:hypothetical protein
VLIKENGQWYIAHARNLFLHDGTPGHEWKNQNKNPRYEQVLSYRTFLQKEDVSLMIFRQF